MTDNRARDAEVATKIMRLPNVQQVTDHVWVTGRDYTDPGDWIYGDDDAIPSLVPHYSTDIAAAQAMEVELERQGKHLEYVRELGNIIAAELRQQRQVWPGTWKYNLNFRWSLLRATPAQRVQAGLQTIGDANGHV